ncbi:MAG: 3-phosphoshikimate 1-carboxyvinyltransferase [Clostridia bacterium]|nr:3-phosphoshikimate 1-carboxyvinyltransferase [Lachnospiraceae bacterium]NCB99922.1 3-phosphoshikimate 1-carboxyvinyltransferase [Clostridia bacterium]NCD04035.1 3-phosphoshikimate 1-carboxyvinyltransferase [Clostridia bacterium]
MKITRTPNGLKGTVSVPGDKSISHRSIMLGSIAEGTTEVHHFLQGADCLSSIACFRQMGIPIENNGDIVRIHGKGLHGLSQPENVLDTGNSGTTTRLMSGILAGQNFDCVINGDTSIQSRPMKRIMTPLAMMGASIESIRGNGCAPLKIAGQKLCGIHYDSPVASAQVKSAVLFAGLYADGETSVTEPTLSRNHTELMLKACGCSIRTEGTTAILQPAKQLTAQRIDVPGDISSAAYFMAAGLIVPGSEICIENVGINPTRDGMIKVCQAMGGNITLENVREVCNEPVADIVVRHSTLHGTVIEGDIIPTLIDELPIIAIMAAFAEGQTSIRDAAELKVKESDRIAVMSENLQTMGVDIIPQEDGMIINGGKMPHGGIIQSHLDHRIAMSFAVAALASDGETEIIGSDCVNISYPTFYEDLFKLS